MKTALVAVLFLCAPFASLAEVPFQFATIDLRAPDDPHVDGLRFAVLHGSNRSVRGIDLGLIAKSETGSLTGFSAIVGLGQVNGDVRGIASAAVNLHRGTDRGLNAAFINRIQRMEAGANVGVVNVTDGQALVDIGGINLSGSGTVQVGFLNMTRRIRGVQIGVLNFADNGFLPIFPFFNFPKN